MKYNKIFSYMVLGMGAAISLGSCSDDNGSNPILQQPTSFELFHPEFNANVVDLEAMDDDEGITLTWNQPKFAATADGVVAPIGYNTNGMAGTSYKVEVSPNGTFTKAFDASLINTKTGEYTGDKDFDYVIIDNVYQTTTSTVLGKDLDMALNRFNAFADTCKSQRWSEGQDIDPMKVTIRVQARVLDGAGTTYASIYSNTTVINVKPYWTQTYTKASPEPIYMIGTGSEWGFDNAPILTWNDDDEALEGYVYLCPQDYGSGPQREFKFTSEPNWSATEWNSSNFTQDLCSNNVVVGEGTGNISFTEDADGMCFVKVNYEKGSIVIEPRPWFLVGDFNSWTAADPAQEMTYDTKARCMMKENAGITANGWKFVVDSGWKINLGGSLDNLTQDGGNLSDEGKTVKLYLEKFTSNKDNFKIHATVE